MNTHQPSQIRHWTRELELIRRRVGRINLREDDALASRMMAVCLSKCEILLEELARGEEESDRLRRLATAERENWQRLFDVMPLACVLTDAQGIVRGVNLAGALLLNVSASRLQGQMFLHFVIDRQRLFDALDEHGDGTSLMRVHVRVRPREKALIEVELGVIADAANTGDRLWFLMPTTVTQNAQSVRRSLEASPPVIACATPVETNLKA
jgi:PAS domain-containing protein